MKHDSFDKIFTSRSAGMVMARAADMLTRAAQYLDEQENEFTYHLTDAKFTLIEKRGEVASALLALHAAEEIVSDATTEREAKLRAIDEVFATPSRIVKAYSGKRGCMCGCKGRYSTTTRMLNNVYESLRGHVDDVDTGDACGGEKYMAVNIDDRTFAVYYN